MGKGDYFRQNFIAGNYGNRNKFNKNFYEKGKHKKDKKVILEALKQRNPASLGIGALTIIKSQKNLEEKAKGEKK